ncbi:putative ATP-binding cassette transporter [Mucilaginibacter oryzae]|uniref:Putative ATP-binding cassette transporter n=1 Tax=Mucilaginibacter oryzae TaxID=468058 RepID=A0A316GTT0_9SPHI|nr:cyclic peptide export ABC transporter [Mucilaginibacter oryzae]PWK65251.1 putative ATP-binding cassette transporter [Mucilaginibacter oryzae]
MNSKKSLLIQHLGHKNLLKYSAIGVIAGILNFLFIFLATKTIDLIMSGSYRFFDWRLCLQFTGVILTFIMVRLTLTKSLIQFSQSLLWKLRKDLVQRSLESRYPSIKRNENDIRTALMYDIVLIHDAILGLIEITTASVITLGCLAYLVYLSPVIFGVTAIASIVGIIVHRSSLIKNRLEFNESHRLESSFLSGVNDILLGCKELFMSKEKSHFIFKNKINDIGNLSISTNNRAYTRLINNALIGQVLLYAVISFVVLFISISASISHQVIVKSVFALIYFLGSLQSVVSLLPAFSRASTSVTKLSELTEKLPPSTAPEGSGASLNIENFEMLDIRQLRFHYGEFDSAFRIGPVDLNLSKGELVFIYGGNGSGKTTLINLVLGFYKPDSGSIKINDLLIDNQSDSYKSLYSVVFADFYLFDQILSVEEPDLNLWERYFQLFQINEKVQLQGNSYSTVQLSTGQRKRLALIVALMEHKPILVLDEWAADQDPEFRSTFYFLILPLLKKEGRTIIAITHDDRYYDCADSLYKMENGCLERI